MFILDEKEGLGKSSTVCQGGEERLSLWQGPWVGEMGCSLLYPLFYSVMLESNIISPPEYKTTSLTQRPFQYHEALMELSSSTYLCKMPRIS